MERGARPLFFSFFVLCCSCTRGGATLLRRKAAALGAPRPGCKGRAAGAVLPCITHLSKTQLSVSSPRRIFPGTGSAADAMMYAGAKMYEDDVATVSRWARGMLQGWFRGNGVCHGWRILLSTKGRVSIFSVQVGGCW